MKKNGRYIAAGFIFLGIIFLFFPLDGVNKYLNARGFSNSDLTKARKRQPFQDTILDLQSENCCDFCGLCFAFSFGEFHQRH